MKSKITTLFVDIGGVLGTNGWDRHSRKKAVDSFKLDGIAFEQKHRQFNALLETGAITLEQYLSEVVFDQPRSFSKGQFIEFMFGESQPDWEMIQMIQEIKKNYRLYVAAVSNESKELADYRIKFFDLKSCMDCFFVSGFVYLQKPDPRIYQLALNVSQVKPEEVLYIDDRSELVEAAAELGIAGIQHSDIKATKAKILSYF